MKCIRLIITLFFGYANVSAQDISEKVIPLLTLRINHTAAPEGYGRTPDKPVLSGAFLNGGNMERMTLEMAKLYNTYRWPNGEKLNFANRSNVAAQGKGMVDCYTLFRNGSTDTIKLYVNAYQKGDLYLPKGLAFLDGKAVTKEIIPILKKIEDIAAANDAFADSTIKERQAEVMIYLQKNVGLDYFIDDKIMGTLMSDKSATMDIKGYLFRTYLFSRFWAVARDFKDEKDYGIRKMAEAYRKVKVIHPEVKSKIFDEWLTM